MKVVISYGIFNSCRFSKIFQTLRTTSATEIIHEELGKKLSNIPGVLNIHDDIIVGKKDTDDHV